MMSLCEISNDNPFILVIVYKLNKSKHQKIGLKKLVCKCFVVQSLIRVGHVFESEKIGYKSGWFLDEKGFLF